MKNYYPHLIDLNTEMHLRLTIIEIIVKEFINIKIILISVLIIININFRYLIEAFKAEWHNFLLIYFQIMSVFPARFFINKIEK